MERDKIEKSLTYFVINILDTFIPINISKFYLQHRIKTLEKNFKKFEDKIAQDKDYFQERFDELNNYIDSEEFKEKVSFIISEYLLLSIDDFKFEEFYLYFKSFMKNPKIELSEIYDILELTKHLSKNDFRNLIQLDKMLMSNGSSGHFFPIRYNPKSPFYQFTRPHIYIELTEKDSSKLIRYGLVELNYEELVDFIQQINAGQNNMFLQPYKPRYKISKYGNWYIQIFKELYENPEKKD